MNIENLEAYLDDEYSRYMSTTDDPMQYDDWLAGSDVPEQVQAREQLKAIYSE